jgi:phosphoglucosamine mutase
MRHFFGTDGIRGKANQFPMTVEIAQKLGQAAGLHFRRGEHRHSVLLGKDTRLSGYMIESALVSGFLSVGMDVTLVGPLPTPAIAMLTRSLRADLGVMISASHNPFCDNGIKLFGPDGFKLSDQDEAEIESLMETDLHDRLAPPEQIGRASRLNDAAGRYVESAKASFPARAAAGWHENRHRLRQWLGLPRGAHRLVGTGGRGGACWLRARWGEYQCRVWFHSAQGPV